MAGEFDEVQFYLRERYKAAADIVRQHKNDDSYRLGEIRIYCAYTLLRQTGMIISYQNGRLSGWLSTTIPPSRTVGRTPTLVFDTGILPKDHEGSSLGQLMWGHCGAIMKLAEERDDCMAIDCAHDIRSFSHLHASAKEHWSKLYNDALSNMRPLSEKPSFLIEVAAQHPLVDDKPGPEFTARLEMAIWLYNKLKAKKCLKDEHPEVKIYVPGSRHMYDGKADGISLSEAGRRYLEGKIPPEDILGEKENLAYMGEWGVYNSSDECYVAARIYKEGEFERLYCICSPNQVARKTAYYIGYGIMPLCYSVPVEEMFHNSLDDVFGRLDSVLYRHGDWQDPESDLFRNSRRERDPDWKE